MSDTLRTSAAATAARGPSRRAAEPAAKDFSTNKAAATELAVAPQ